LGQTLHLHGEHAVKELQDGVRGRFPYVETLSMSVLSVIW
jgi:hypothetical protein